MRRNCFCLLMVLICLPLLSWGLTFQLPSKRNGIVGHSRAISVPYGFNITELGQRYQVGYLEFYEANPGVNLNDLDSGEHLVIPTQYVLPDAPRKGIVINLAELRLYYYPSHRHVVVTFPVGVGRKRIGSETPIFRSRIASKRENPIWVPTPDTRVEALEKGIQLPPYIAPGPENPLGDYAMRIGATPYLIHGTNDPSGVGIRSSGGCIRMYPANVEELFYLVNIGTTVNIVDQPFKVGWNGNKLFLEAHVPIDVKRARAHQLLQQITKLVMPEIKKWHAKVDWKKVLKVANQQNGIPQQIGDR